MKRLFIILSFLFNFCPMAYSLDSSELAVVTLTDGTQINISVNMKDGGVSLYTTTITPVEGNPVEINSYTERTFIRNLGVLQTSFPQFFRATKSLIRSRLRKLANSNGTVETLNINLSDVDSLQRLKFRAMAIERAELSKIDLIRRNLIQAIKKNKKFNKRNFRNGILVRGLKKKYDSRVRYLTKIKNEINAINNLINNQIAAREVVEAAAEAVGAAIETAVAEAAGSVEDDVAGDDVADLSESEEHYESVDSGYKSVAR